MPYIATYVYGLITLFMLLTIDIDIPECDDNNGNCKHNCVEIPGSYHCTCYTGYQLHSDKHSCIGKDLTDT